MFVKARKDNRQWLLANRWGHELVLPCRPDCAGLRLRIGTPGTEFEPNGLRNEKRKVLTRTTIMAHMRSDLGAPIYLLDVRRNGTGPYFMTCPLSLGGAKRCLIPFHPLAVQRSLSTIRIIASPGRPRSGGAERSKRT